MQFIGLQVPSASCSVVVPDLRPQQSRKRRAWQRTRSACWSCFSFRFCFLTDRSFLSPPCVWSPSKGGPQDKEALTRHKAGRKTEPGTNEKSRDGDGTKDYYEECLDMSAALERRPNQHNWFKANSMYNVSEDEPGDRPALT